MPAFAEKNPDKCYYFFEHTYMDKYQDVYENREIVFSNLSFITWVQSEFTGINVFEKWEQIMNSHCVEKNIYIFASLLGVNFP